MEKVNITTDPAKILELLMIAVVGGVISSRIGEQGLIDNMIVAVILYFCLGLCLIFVQILFNRVVRNAEDEEPSPNYWPPQRAS